jgi:twitching motility protein PilJ
MLLLVAATLAWSSYRSFQLISEVNQIQRPLQELSGRIRYLDEVLTSSALLAATTGNPVWEERYNKNVTQLDIALQEAVKLAPGAEKPLKAVEAANAELETMESKALEQVRRGNTTAARQLLDGERYREHKQRYAEALTAFTVFLDAHQEALLTRSRAETQAFVGLAMAAALVILLLFVAGGWVALRSLRRV